MASPKQQHLGRRGVDLPNLQKKRVDTIAMLETRGGGEENKEGSRVYPCTPECKGGVPLHRTGAVTSRVLPSCLTEPRPRPQLCVPLLSLLHLALCSCLLLLFEPASLCRFPQPTHSIRGPCRGECAPPCVWRRRHDPEPARLGSFPPSRASGRKSETPTSSAPPGHQQQRSAVPANLAPVLSSSDGDK